MSALPQIRLAVAEDAVALLDLAVRTFHDTFAKDNDPVHMAAYLEDAFSLQRIEAEMADTANTFFLAFTNPSDAPIGYAKLRAGAPDPAVQGPAPLEVERLYVHREAIGQGVGAALMQACLDEAARTGYQTVWLGVWGRNKRATAFYRRWGFREVGTHQFMLGSDEQTDLIMEKAVGF